MMLYNRGFDWENFLFEIEVSCEESKYIVNFGFVSPNGSLYVRVWKDNAFWFGTWIEKLDTTLASESLKTKIRESARIWEELQIFS